MTWEVFWMRVLEAYLVGLEQRQESVLLASVEATMVETAMANLSRPTAWIDRPMSKATFQWMNDNCPCQVWEVLR